MYTWGYLKEASLSKMDWEQEEANAMGILKKFPIYANEVITQISSSVKPKHSFWEVDVTSNELDTLLTINDVNFISFGDDRCTIEYYNVYGVKIVEECHDDILEYVGYNQFICKRAGKYRISYNARWYSFDYTTDDNEVLPVPADILDCIPSYIAHQCLKMDEEYKSAVYRNEYETFLARIDDTNYKNTKTFVIGGDW